MCYISVRNIEFWTTNVEISMNFAGIQRLPPETQNAYSIIRVVVCDVVCRGVSWCVVCRGGCVGGCRGVCRGGCRGVCRDQINARGKVLDSSFLAVNPNKERKSVGGSAKTRQSRNSQSQPAGPSPNHAAASRAQPQGSATTRSHSHPQQRVAITPNRRRRSKASLGAIVLGGMKTVGGQKGRTPNLPRGNCFRRVKTVGGQKGRLQSLLRGNCFGGIKTVGGQTGRIQSLSPGNCLTGGQHRKSPQRTNPKPPSGQLF